MNITYSRDSAKDINSMDKTMKQRIKAGIEKIPQGDIKPLKGSTGTYRLRVGDWRVLFSYLEGDTIYIRKIGPRGDVYKGV